VATNDKLLEHNTNNFLAGLHANGDQFGIAFLDISTRIFLWLREMLNTQTNFYKVSSLQN
jgi:DNA mismatch repair ATPase MutS